MFRLSDQQRGLARRLGRPVMIGCAISVLGLAVAGACGADEGSEPVPPTRTPDPDDRGVIMATFTPVPTDFTPEALQTRAAIQTAAVETATALGSVTPTPPPPMTGDPSAWPTQAPNEVRPPLAILSSSTGQAGPEIGTYRWCQPELNMCAGIDDPVIAIPEDGLTLAPGAPAQITIDQTPFAPVSAVVEFFGYDENVGQEADMEGQPTGNLAFVEQVPPVSTQQITGPSLNFTTQAEPGAYFLRVTITWETPEGIHPRLVPLQTIYLYNVQVV